jgi:hypothetical protein
LAALLSLANANQARDRRQDKEGFASSSCLPCVAKRVKRASNTFLSHLSISPFYLLLASPFALLGQTSISKEGEIAR